MEPLTVPINEATRILGIGRTTLYALIGSGELEAIKIGRRTLVRTESIKKLVKLEPAA